MNENDFKDKIKDLIRYSDNLSYDPSSVSSRADIILDGIRSRKIMVNFNGHYEQPVGPIDILTTEFKQEYSYKHLLIGIDVQIESYIDENIYIAGKWASGQQTDPVKINSHIRGCSNCGESVNVYFDGKVITIGDTKCSIPGAPAPYSVQINVPSGKLICENDLREFVPGVEDMYTTAYVEMVKYVNEYAAGGLFHAFVGNSCPSLYLKNNDILTVANVHDDDDEDYIDHGFGEQVGSICTDLWWFSIMDEDTLLKNHKEFYPNDKKFNFDEMKFTIIDVEPGLYEMTVHPMAIKNDMDEIVHYATIKRIGECK